MSLWKAIHHGKEKRKQHRGSKAFDYSCHNHGGCGWCEANRQYQDRRERMAADEQIKEFRYECKTCGIKDDGIMFFIKGNCIKCHNKHVLKKEDADKPCVDEQ